MLLTKSYAAPRERAENRAQPVAATLQRVEDCGVFRLQKFIGWMIV
jgi:hypothetical protein